MSGGYVFRSTWRLAAPAGRVYAILADVETYPSWWPQVRRTRRLDEISGELTCRSLLPYDLTFTMSREVEDPAAGVLRAAMTGDLVGTSQWTIRPAGGAQCLAVFDEDVEVGISLLRSAGRLFRPVLRANHDHMMRSGERGLRAYLSRGGASTPAARA